MLINLIIFVFIPQQKNINEWSALENVVFIVFSRITFVFGFVLIILPPVINGKGLVFKLFKNNFIAPIGKLVFF